MKDCPGVRHNLTTLTWDLELFCSPGIGRTSFLNCLTAFFWEKQPYGGSQTNRIPPIAIVFLKHWGPSEMLCELKPPPSIGISGDVVKWLILILPEDHFSFPSWYSHHDNKF